MGKHRFIHFDVPREIAKKRFMPESKLSEYKFQSIYKFVNIVYMNVEAGVDFWNFNQEAFVKSALKFNRNSLLHIYVASTLYCYYWDEFSDMMDDDEVEWWIKLLKIYKIKISDVDYDEDENLLVEKWFANNKDKFIEFFELISDEVVHILFNDKHFLVLFNRLVRNVLIDDFHVRVKNQEAVFRAIPFGCFDIPLHANS